VIKAVTFDFWWTLFHHLDEEKTHQVRARRIRDFLAAEGHRVPEPAIRRVLDLVREIAIDYQYNRGRDFTPADQIAFLLAWLGVDDGDGALQEGLYPAYTTVLYEVPPTPAEGVRQVLAELYERYPLGLVCNTGTTPGSTLRRIMAEEGLERFFRHLTFSDETGIAKPDPDIFRLTLRAMGVEGQEAVHVGDDPRSDIMGAQLAGLRTVWLRSRSVAVPAQGHDAEVAELRQVPAVIARLAEALE